MHIRLLLLVLSSFVMTSVGIFTFLAIFYKTISSWFHHSLILLLFFLYQENLLNKVSYMLFSFPDSTSVYRTDFPKPEMMVSCLSDGVQVEIFISETEGFNGVLYVKGHSKDEQCRRVLTLPANSMTKTELFKVQFGNCGLIHVNVRRYIIFYNI